MGEQAEFEDQSRVGNGGGSLLNPKERAAHGAGQALSPFGPPLLPPHAYLLLKTLL